MGIPIIFSMDDSPIYFHPIRQKHWENMLGGLKKFAEIVLMLQEQQHLPMGMDYVSWRVDKWERTPVVKWRADVIPLTHQLSYKVSVLIVQ